MPASSRRRYEFQFLFSRRRELTASFCAFFPSDIECSGSEATITGDCATGMFFRGEYRERIRRRQMGELLVAAPGRSSGTSALEPPASFGSRFPDSCGRYQQT
jgi:hypothetical protein